ncbi:hypothetical protein T484DRAFT_1785402 [Baffinella frigidus]|nr:hypothetical protein T484DRAFT_1785402 [Cryptophyta sp. CCMP2293]
MRNDDGEEEHEGQEMRVRVATGASLEDVALRRRSAEEFLRRPPEYEPRALRVCSCAFFAVASCLFFIGMAMGSMFIPVQWNWPGGKIPCSPGPPGRELAWRALPSDGEELSRIAFGTCANQIYPAAYLDVLSDLQPQLTVLGGDNVYGDCSSMACPELHAAYDLLRRRPSWRGAANTLATVATWDDHDVGKSDGDASNPYKVGPGRLDSALLHPGFRDVMSIQ